MNDFATRIVCVDDEQTMRSLVRASLENAGFDGALATCGSAKEFLRRYRELQPDLILLDLLMPEMDGLEMLNFMAKDPEIEDIPVIMVTAVKKLVMTPEYKKLGVIGVVHKPFEPQNLLEIVQEIWSEDRADGNEETEPED